MPIYEYRCESCGHELEAFQKISADPLTDCPACGTPKLKKKISAAGFRLKGSGWYETDFKNRNQKNLAKDMAAKDTESKDTAAKDTGSKDTAAKPAEIPAKSSPGAASGSSAKPPADT